MIVVISIGFDLINGIFHGELIGDLMGFYGGVLGLMGY